MTDKQIYLIEEITKKMKVYAQEGGDPESNHVEADRLLVEVLRIFDLNDLANIYEDVEKWFS